MTIDLSKIRPGDEVLVKAILLQNVRDAYCLDLTDSGIWVTADSIVSYCKPKYKPKAGDMVEFENSFGETHKGKIIAIHNGKMWFESAPNSISSLCGVLTFYKLTNLRNVEP